MSTPTVIVSGGAEAVSLAVVERCVSLDGYAFVYALGSSSLLAGVPRCEVHFAPAGPREAVLEDLEGLLRSRFGTSGVLAIATEDDSLGILVDAMEARGQDLRLSRCRALSKGGLDKAEVFQFLQREELGRFLAVTQEVRCLDDLERVADTLGPRFVLKPVHKPWGDTLPGGVKLFREHDLQLARVRQLLRTEFERGQTWVAQPLLQPISGGERSACVVRDASGQYRYAEVIERMKFPGKGGSACWVETCPGSEVLREATESIVGALDLVGVAELSFLADADGNPKLLELNPRPWLQIELLQASGFDVLSDMRAVVLGGALQGADTDVAVHSWISLERFLLKLLKGDGVPRRETLKALALAVRKKPMVSVWSCSLPGVRARWLRRCVARFVS